LTWQREERKVEVKRYTPLPTIRRFHESPGQIRCIVGPVGSGKTSGATLEIGYYLPYFLFEHYKIKKTRWAVVRNSYRELKDTTQKTVQEWFPDAGMRKSDETVIVRYDNGIESELMFRSCDRPQDVKKFKSLEITGYWIDESIEVADEIKRMLKNRIGRFPQKCPVRFGIETTNPPDIEHPTYSDFAWDTVPPGPIPEGKPKPNHVGFWQPPRENAHNLRPGYYEDLRNDYRDNQDWIEIYIEGKPGIVIRGKSVYHNFKRSLHVAQVPLTWTGGPLYLGWDNTGNTPAAVVVQSPTAGRYQVLSEFHTDRQNIVRFTQDVVAQCNQKFPNCKTQDWADPAGNAEFSTKEGGWTSNAKLMKEAADVVVVPSEQNLTARINAVDSLLGMTDGLLIDPGCTRLINGFIGGYCYAESSIPGQYQDTPEKNRFSHVHDALQYVLVKLTKNNVGESGGFVPMRNVKPYGIPRPLAFRHRR